MVSVGEQGDELDALMNSRENLRRTVAPGAMGYDSNSMPS